MLQAKVDAGATRAMTQFFFNNDCYWRYLERVRARGINIPVVPGLIPIHNFKQVASFASRCGASIPTDVAERFEGLAEIRKRRSLSRQPWRPNRSWTLSRAASRSFISTL